MDISALNCRLIKCSCYLAGSAAYFVYYKTFWYALAITHSRSLYSEELHSFIS